MSSEGAGRPETDQPIAAAEAHRPLDRTSAVDRFQREAARWVRLLFERLRRRRPGLGPLAGIEGGGPTPTATVLAGAPDEISALDSEIRRRGDELVRQCCEPLSDGEDSPLGALRRRFGLESLELQLLVVLTMYQTDRSLREVDKGSSVAPRLSVGTLAELVSGTLRERREALRCLRPGAPIRQFQLVQVGQADQGPGPEGRAIQAHERIVEVLGGATGNDPRLVATSRLEEPRVRLEQLPVPDTVARALVNAHRACGRPNLEPVRRRLALVGADAGLKVALMAGLAGAYSRPLFVVDLRAIVRLFSDPEVSLAEHLREGILQEGLIYVDGHGLEDLDDRTRLLMSSVLRGVDRPLAVGYASRDAAPLELQAPFCVQVPLPEPEARERLWRRFLTEHLRVPPDASVVAELARRFVLGYDAIRQAALEAATDHQVAGGRAPLNIEDVSAAARRHQTHQLGRWAQRVECRHDWSDLVVGAETDAALRRVAQHVVHHARVFDEWGFGRQQAKGRGLTVLFHGEPGTGKTMAASVIARSLGRDLFKVDLSKVTSKWVGETEKHLDEIFEQARVGGAILLFDEADSLFARRTEVRTSGDRYANLSVGFLLQRLEDYDGVSILTTNRAESLDDAFRRRIRIHIEFPLPDAAQRLELWRTLIPDRCEVEEPLDLERLSQDYDLGGGNIRNAALRAAFAAAEDGGPLRLRHLTDAADEEYRSLGRLVRRQSGD